MALVLIDTYQVTRNLKDWGFSDDQAEGITEAIKSLDLEMLASKADLANLETRLTVRMATFLSLAVAVQSLIVGAIELFAR